jgi:formylglycine-generating enzyme required for sulfatase activity
VLRDRFLDGSGVGPDLVLIPTGRFQMGSTNTSRRRRSRPGAEKLAGARAAAALGRHRAFVCDGPLSGHGGQWRQFVKDTGWESQSDTDWRAPGFAQTDEHPVVGVSWMDAQLYLRWLSQKTGRCTADRSGMGVRLPRRYQTAFSFGDTISTEQANYDGHYTYNGGQRGAYVQGTSKVGAYQPNPWGLFDMHGNVWEWTQDVVHDNYVGAPADGSAWEEGGDPVRRVLRGGSWLYNPRYLRSAVRNGFSAVLANDIVGFRVARKLA